MGTTAQKLQNILNAKNSISAAIELKGGTVPTELTAYGAAIQALPSGGSSEVLQKFLSKTGTEITSSDLEGVTALGPKAFAEWDSLTACQLPDTLSAMGQRVFEGVDGDKGKMHIDIPESVVSFGDGMFSDAKNISSVTFKNDLTSLPNSTFYSAQYLTYVKFETASLASAQTYAFGGSQSGRLSVDFTALTSVPTIPGTAFPSSTRFLVNADYYNDFCEASNFSSVSARIFPITIE